MKKLITKGAPENKNLLVFTSHIKVIKTDGDTITIRGMASTKETDRVGDIMDPECWNKGGLDNYKKNAIILFNHDYDKPIGKATEFKVTDGGLEITAKISKADPYIAKLIEDGVLSAFSVGFRTRDSDYVKETGGLLIKDAELFEVSVVSVPANQSALFDVVKSFTPEQYSQYKKSLTLPDPGTVAVDAAKGKLKMNEEELKEMIAKLLADGFSAQEAKAKAEAEQKRLEVEATEKAAAEAAKKAALEAELEAAKAQVTNVSSGVEKLLADIEKRFSEKEMTSRKELDELKKTLADNATDMEALRNSKRSFQAQKTNDWQKAAEPELRDAYMMGLLTDKGWNSALGQSTIEKVNAMSGLGVAATTAAVYETVVSTAIERDIEHMLVLAPLFREIRMTAASMIMPIMPDAGYAEFIATKTLTNTGINAPEGNLSTRGDAEGSPYGGVDLGTQVLTTKKLMSLSYLANETEEDAIMPILPLINESMVRSHVRAVERSMLLGSSGIGSYDGLTVIANTNSKVLTSPTAFASDALTTDDLLGMRRSLGKYGTRPSDVVYIVSEKAWYDLLEDPEYKDASLVGDANAVKLTGAVGKVYNSNVILCDEFLTAATGAFHAIALNARNFIVPRLRGVTLESQYVPRLQHRELIATQRLGFDEIIPGASAVVARKYAAA